jgi:hypothetical protein
MSLPWLTIESKSHRALDFLGAIVLAVTADAVQILVMPFFTEGALSPPDDVLDVVVAVILVRLLGWHWEFLPALIGEITPSVDDAGT